MQPNILYIHSHDTGRYIEPYGHPVSTPNLQRLAEEGTLFRQAFCANPTCSPSRAALLTGRYPHSCGMLGLVNRGFEMPDYSTHFVQVAKRHGYHAVLSGVQHEAKDWRTIGYDESIATNPEAHVRAAEFLKSGPQRPFFLSVGFAETHRVFPELEESDTPQYVMPPAQFPDTPETRADFARFKKSASILDEKIGHVLDALEESGMKDETIVVCTTDHGIAFPRMKCNLTDAGIGVMLMIRGPGGFDEGKTIDALVSHIDIVPTLCEMADIEPPAHLQGVSLVPLVADGTESVRRRVFAEVNFHASNEPERCVRTKRWKYVRRWFEGFLHSCDKGETRSLLLDGGWNDRPEPTTMLYDLLLDPCEMRNLAGDSYFAPIESRLDQELREWMIETEDPILDGPLVAPESASLPDEPVCRSDKRIPLTLD